MKSRRKKNKTKLESIILLSQNRKEKKEEESIRAYFLLSPHESNGVRAGRKTLHKVCDPFLSRKIDDERQDLAVFIILGTIAVMLIIIK